MGFWTRIIPVKNINRFQRYFSQSSCVFHHQQMNSMDKEARSSSSRKAASFLSPPLHHGMTKLDRSKFTKEVKVPCVTLNEHNITNIMKSLKPYLMKRIRFNPVEIDPSNPEKKKIYLNPDFVTEVSEMLEKLAIDQKISTVSTDTIKLTYENYTWEEILDAIIPDELEKIGGYTLVGSLIHLNLRDHLIPYKEIIAQVLLDKLHFAKTVVNKLQTIDSTYRNFQMEILAGNPSTIVKIKECGIEFEFDFATVYWNSRLSSEHERIIKFLTGGDILFDVFAGVGPFAIPAGKKRCYVYANDLNPESFKWLNHNIKKRKLDSFIKTFNMDGVDFIKTQLPQLIIKSPAKELAENISFTRKIHITMNLPALAVEFLEHFWNLVNSKEILLDELQLIIHVYTFIKAAVEQDEFKKMAIDLVRSKLRHDLTEDYIIESFFVRNVAPNKNMVRVSFRLPLEILWSEMPPSRSVLIHNDDEIHPTKRIKINSNAEGTD